ncbi:MAG: hypothetical protein SF162_01560 [bacterium]|nr:hypothetical protein [bacterium]
MAATTTTLQAPARPQRSPERLWSQTRVRFALTGLAIMIIALVAMFQASNAYTTTREVFRSITEVNSSLVDASENALQYIAQASQAAADYALLTSDTPLFEQAQNDVFRAFAQYRDEMATLSATLQSDDERAAYTVAETITYSRFWRHVSNLVAQRTNEAVARREYLDADNHVRNWINPALQELERLNYDEMVRAGATAGSVISSQAFRYAVPALAVLFLLGSFSMEVRRKVRRLLTPGVDLALVLSLVLLAVLLTNLNAAPSDLNFMIGNAYRGVSASSRVLVEANLANRAESSALIDPEAVDAWMERFDAAADRIQLRLCGQDECTDSTFVNFTNSLERSIVDGALRISAEDSARIDGIAPLAVDVTLLGEGRALEAARIAYNDFIAANTTLRTMIKAGRVEDAILFNTSTDGGTSQEAFLRLEEAINRLITLHRDVFDQTWANVGSTLQRNQQIAVIGYGAIAILALLGALHRYREL